MTIARLLTTVAYVAVSGASVALLAGIENAVVPVVLQVAGCVALGLAWGHPAVLAASALPFVIAFTAGSGRFGSEATPLSILELELGIVWVAAIGTGVILRQVGEMIGERIGRLNGSRG